MLLLVPTPLGNLGDITIRALEALENADVILCEDTRHAKKLFSLLAQKYGSAIHPKKLLSFHEHNQHAFLRSLSPEFFEQNVVYISDAGMPGVSDPGALLVRYAQEHGVAYSVLPGPSAAITAYAASGFSCTQFAFYGFLPAKGAQRHQQLQKALREEKCVILYEAPHRLIQFLEEVSHLDPQRELFLAKELTKLHERFYKGAAQDLYEELKGEKIQGEWVIVVAKSMCNSETLELTKEELLALPLPKRELAKLLAKITPQSAKEWYSILTKS